MYFGRRHAKVATKIYEFGTGDEIESIQAAEMG
jgi:hypothetical protein